MKLPRLKRKNSPYSSELVVNEQNAWGRYGVRLFYNDEKVDYGSTNDIDEVNSIRKGLIKKHKQKLATQKAIEKQMRKWGYSPVPHEDAE